nr:hypothetical protein [bacterium]
LDFYATPDPIAEVTLMKRVVGSGLQGLQRLVAELPEPGPQLDALAAVAAYIDVTQGHMWPVSADSIFADSLLPHLDLSFGPALIHWLGDASLGTLHWRLIGLLPLCGGAEASAWLARYYDLTSQHFDPPDPPYTLSKPEPDAFIDFADGQEFEITFRDWAERTAGSDRYVICVGKGFASRRELLLGIDRGSDGSFEELLATGLTDSWFSAGQDIEVLRFRGKLALTLRRGAVTIAHHVPVMKFAQLEYDDKPYWQTVDTRRVSTTLHLSDLRRDSDGDGLTDIAESRLLSDPYRPDTDGDGEPDRTDRAPTTDPASSGLRERGTARALAYDAAEDEWSYSRFDYTPQQALPYEAWYVECAELGHFTYARKGSRGYYLLPLSTAREQESGMALIPPGDYFAAPTKVGWSAQISDYQKDYWAGASDSRIKACVYTSSTAGRDIFMTELDGEWYPVYSTVTWII